MSCRTLIVCLMLVAGVCAGAPAVAAAELNRIEAAATPATVGTFELHGEQGRRSATRAGINATIVLASVSDGLAPGEERVVVKVGETLTALEPGSLEPHGPNEWRYSGAGALAELRLKQKPGGRRWDLKLSHARLPGEDVLMRIGDDLAAFGPDGGTVDLRPRLEEGAAVSATIGSAGGFVATGGFRLVVPPGALEGPVTIRMSPHESGDGVRLEPEGLSFALPATLTAPAGAGSLALATSPLSHLPLFAPRPDSAWIVHFSSYAVANPTLTDVADWADPVLSAAPSTLTISEIISLAALVQAQQAAGCSTPAQCARQDALYRSLLAQVERSIDTLAAAKCDEDVAAATGPIYPIAGPPARAAGTALSLLQRWAVLEQTAQAIGAGTSAALGCMDRILNKLVVEAGLAGRASPSLVKVQELDDLRAEATARNLPSRAAAARVEMAAILQALIDAAGAAARATPDDAELQRLVDLHASAAQFRFPSLETAALQHLAAAIREIVSRAQPVCATNVTAAIQELTRAAGWAARLGPQLAAVDASLQADVARALAGCTPRVMPAFSVIVRPFARVDAMVLAGITTGRRCVETSWIGVAAPLPLYLNAVCPGGTRAALGITQPTATSFVATAEALVNDPASFASGYAQLEMTFGVAGTLHLTKNPAWATALSNASGEVSMWPGSATVAVVAGDTYRLGIQIGMRCTNSPCFGTASGFALEGRFVPA